MSYTSTFFKNIVHLLYPEICAGCGSDLLSPGNLICQECTNDMPLTDFYMHLSNPVEKIFHGRLPVVTASAHTYFTKDSVVQHLLHGLKYGGNKESGMAMGSMIGKTLKTCEWNTDLYALIPLPLHFRKQKMRGYNQAELICKGISNEMNVPVLNNVIVRRKNTESQTHKTRMERWNNINSKFELKNAAALTDKHVLLVDDVITTGATLEACGAELLKTAGLRLSIAAFAYTSL
ncbi:MAG TPA: phosphoribosyltransferase family protein [Flavitalea sp.]|nr:phosphoribosyltransferase family protein [Flavitalea sp.]